MNGTVIFIKSEQQAQALHNMLKSHLSRWRYLSDNNIDRVYSVAYVQGVREALECVVGAPAYALLEAFKSKL